jgi:outer membrane protein OmpA-like peptidoglycan-associated protein
LRPAGQDPRLLNRSTEEPNRATGEENRSLKKYPQSAAGSAQRKPPAFEELKQLIDEEQSNRLNPMDGYNKPPPRPREGFGPQLRSQFDDINEYFSGPKWHDDRAFVESAESRGLTPPIGPWIDPKRKATRFSEQGEAVRRPEPAPPPPPPPQTVLRAKNIRFLSMNRLDVLFDRPAQFADLEALVEIQSVAKILRENPNTRVKIRASVGADSSKELALFDRDTIEAIKKKRAEAVSKQLEAQGIDPARISTGSGKDGVGAANRIVEFVFDPPVR